MNKTAICLLILCGLVTSCISVPPPTAEEVTILHRSREDLAKGDYDWVLHDMEKFLLDYPQSSFSAEAHLLVGDASKGLVDKARKEKKITGMILTSYTTPWMLKAYESYVTASEKAKRDEVASESLYKSAVMLDIDYLKNFEKALVVYGDVINKFPETAWVESARTRFDVLDAIFRTMRSGPHRNNDEKK